MKPIDVIEAMENNYPPNADPILREALDLAISALEKQIIKPPENKVHEKHKALGKNYYCSCGVMFVDYERNGTNYCGNCGQRLKKGEIVVEKIHQENAEEAAKQ